MTEQSILVPQRRFKEFKSTQAWEEIELKNMGKTFTGLSGKTKDDFGHGSAEFVTYMNVFSNPISDTTMTENVEVDLKQNKLEYGDVLFTVSSETPQEVGMSSVWLSNRPNVYLNSFCFGYRPTVNVSYLFLAYLFRSDTVRKKMMLLAQGISRYNISKNKVMELQVGLPNIYEQEKIGNFFKQLDHTISLHRRKLEKIKALKSAYLSEMFPGKGEFVPKRRFSGFTQDWQVKKMGELAGNFEYGLNASAISFDGINKYIRITDIDDETRTFNQRALTSPDAKLFNAENYVLKKGDILFARTGASVGKTYRYRESDGKVYYAGFLIRARIDPQFDSEFVFQSTLTKQYYDFVRITSQRSGQPGINAQEYSQFNLMVPVLEEQRKIGNFFKQLDDIITHHQSKLKKLQNLKKAYLHEMFV